MDNAQDSIKQTSRAAKDAASATINQQKDSAASGMGGFAQALRKAASESDHGADGGVARIAEAAADGLERISTSLRQKDLNGLMREAESFARSQPVAFFGAAVAAGFLAMRFAKSSRG